MPIFNPSAGGFGNYNKLLPSVSSDLLRALGGPPQGGLLATTCSVSWSDNLGIFGGLTPKLLNVTFTFGPFSGGATGVGNHFFLCRTYLTDNFASGEISSTFDSTGFLSIGANAGNVVQFTFNLNAIPQASFSSSLAFPLIADNYGFLFECDNSLALSMQLNSASLNGFYA